MKTSRRNLPTVILAAIVLVLAIAGSSAAAILITGGDVKDGSLTGADVKNGSLARSDLSLGAQKALLGTPCKLPNGVKGKVTMSVAQSQVITLTCDTPPTVDADLDGFTPQEDDCDDTNDSVFPGAEEVYDGHDNDCDGQLASGTYYTGPPGTANVGSCSPGLRQETTEPPDFYEVTQAEILPEPEIGGDGFDNDCDGVIDEG